MASIILMLLGILSLSIGVAFIVQTIMEIKTKGFMIFDVVIFIGCLFLVFLAVVSGYISVTVL